MAPPELDEATIIAVDRVRLATLLAEADTVAGKAKATVEWVQSTRVGRATARMVLAGGNPLAGGVAYAALFSIFAALAIGWTVFMAVLGGNAELKDSVIDSINQALPGILKDGPDSTGLVSPDDLIVSAAWTLTSVSAVVVLAWSALAVMTSLRKSIQRMFGIVGAPVNFVLGKVKDLTGFVVLGVAVLATSVLGIGAGALGESVLDWLSIQGAAARILLRGLTLLVAAGVDFCVFIFLFRFVAGMRPLRRDLLSGAAIATIAAGALRLIGTGAVKSVSDNPVLASAAALVTLLLWVNLLVRITLIVAAWTANPPAPLRPQSPAELRARERPNYVTVSAPQTLSWSHQGVTGALDPDPTLRTGAVEDPDPAPQPYWDGLIGAVQRARIGRLERRLDRARRSYLADNQTNQ